MDKIRLLVPTDLTSVAENALNHALFAAKVIDAEITLFHLVGKKSEIEPKQDKLAEIANAAKEKMGVEVTPLVREGDIFDGIGGVASELGARLIFMGTHGAVGLQKVLGSYALRVITKSEVPFVVVQDRPVKNGYDRIVLPLDLTKESVQSLTIAAELAKYFNSEIHILGERQSDPHLQNKVKSNIKVAHNLLQKKGVSCTAKFSDGRKSFAKQVIRYAVSVQADMISIVNVQDSILSLFGGFEQDIIANEEEIPALILNPVERLKLVNIF